MVVLFSICFETPSGHVLYGRRSKYSGLRSNPYSNVYLENMEIVFQRVPLDLSKKMEVLYERFHFDLGSFSRVKLSMFDHALLFFSSVTGNSFLCNQQTCVGDPKHMNGIL